MKVYTFSIILASITVFALLFSSQPLSFAASNPYLQCPDCNDTSNIQQIPPHVTNPSLACPDCNDTSNIQQIPPHVTNPSLACPDCNDTSNIQQIQLTSGGTLQVGFSTDPINPNTSNPTQLKINFLNKQNTIQQHIDYKISIIQGGNQVFGIPITHTAEGSVSIPFQFQTIGTYQIIVYVEGVLFQPIPEETAKFSVSISQTSNGSPTTQNPIPDNQTSIPPTPVPPTTMSSKIPHWVKSLFGLYGQGQVSDDDLISALKFLIQSGIIKVN